MPRPIRRHFPLSPKIRKGIRGYVTTFYSIRMKTILVAIPATRKPIIIGEDHGSIAPPICKASRMRTALAMMVMLPSQSTAFKLAIIGVFGAWTLSFHMTAANDMAQHRIRLQIFQSISVRNFRSAHSPEQSSTKVMLRRLWFISWLETSRRALQKVVGYMCC